MAIGTRLPPFRAAAEGRIHSRTTVRTSKGFLRGCYEAAQARYQALLEQKRAAQSQYTEANKRTTSAQATILRQEADLDLAKLNLSYTILIAPYDGYMGRRTLEPGQYVQAGQTISYDHFVFGPGR